MTIATNVHLLLPNPEGVSVGLTISIDAGGVIEINTDQPGLVLCALDRGPHRYENFPIELRPSVPTQLKFNRPTSKNYTYYNHKRSPATGN